MFYDTIYFYVYSHLYNLLLLDSVKLFFGAESVQNNTQTDIVTKNVFKNQLGDTIMEKIVNNGKEGYFLSKEEYESMLKSYDKIHSYLSTMEGMVDE